MSGLLSVERGRLNIPHEAHPPHQITGQHGLHLPAPSPPPPCLLKPNPRSALQHPNLTIIVPDRVLRLGDMIRSWLSDWHIKVFKHLVVDVIVLLAVGIFFNDLHGSDAVQMGFLDWDFLHEAGVCFVDVVVVRSFLRLLMRVPTRRRRRCVNRSADLDSWS